MKEEINFLGHGEARSPSSGAPDRQQAKKGAGVYLFALFAITFLLLLMAHFMQERPGHPTVDQPLPTVTQQVTDEAHSLLGSRYIIN